MNPFEYVNAINYSKKNIMVDDIAEKQYNPYMTNRSLSYFHDTILMANEMNIHHGLNKRLQFHFLLNSIRKRKRFGGKWTTTAKSKNLEYVKQYYGYSNAKAKVALDILNKTQLNFIKERLDKGGRRK